MDKLRHKKSSDEVELKDYKCTRFHVEMVDGSDNCEELNQLCEHENNKQDSGNVKNMRYFTREALPRLDNYRHIMSIQAAYRPTLDDLHNALTTMQPSNHTGDNEEGNRFNHKFEDQGTRGKLGWLRGVFIPNMLSMCSAMLFLRFAWIVVQTGLVEGLFLIFVGAVINSITALSISAISTNGLLKEGGSYGMMSRSLGPEFGIPVGIILLLSSVGLSVMYATGLVEYIIGVTKLCMLDCSDQDTRVFSLLVFLLFTVLVSSCLYLNMSFVPVKIQYVMFALMVAALVDVSLSAIIGPVNGVLEKSFSTFSMTNLKNNLFAKYPDEKNVEYNLLFSLFAIFYPAISDFLTGVTKSDRLKDPLKAISKGTLTSVLASVIVYVLLSVLISGTILHNGEIATILNNPNTTADNPIGISCRDNHCQSNPYDFYYLIESLSQEKNLVRIAAVTATIYCIFTNCITAISSFKLLCTDALYPKLLCFNTKPAINTAQACAFTIVIAAFFILPGSMNAVGPIVSILILSAYALINFSTFHISLIRPVGWRPTFKAYNMWMSLVAAVMCVSIMFLMNWIFALVDLIVILAIYLTVSYQKPEVNWGSSTQAQTYHSALLGVYSLNRVEDHVKNYHPQVLVLTGLPSHRPPLVTFANLITKNTSLLICGHIHTKPVSRREQQEHAIKAQNWLDFHRIKAFYAQVENVTFEQGAKSLLQSCGLGKLKPNILLIGYKSDWLTTTKTDLDMYFNIIHKALDSYLAVCILRVKDGLNFSSLFVDHGHLGETVSRMDLGGNTQGATATINSNHVGKGEDEQDSLEDMTISEIYRTKDGLELPRDTKAQVTLFQGKQKKGTIDVWWLYDDGGLTLLIPYLISIRKKWSACKLRVFALASDYDPLEFEQRNMASLLAKFRIDYSDLTVFSDLMRKPQEETIAFYESLISDFVCTTSDDVESETSEKVVISRNDVDTMQEKTNRHLRLRELLLEHSQDARLVVMTLPIPRKSVVSAGLYMSWLEALTQGMPPFLLIRGNQTSVLTFYS